MAREAIAGGDCNALRVKGQHGLAFILAAVLAAPALLACLFIAFLMVSGVRWN